MAEILLKYVKQKSDEGDVDAKNILIEYYEHLQQKKKQNKPPSIKIPKYECEIRLPSPVDRTHNPTYADGDEGFFGRPARPPMPYRDPCEADGDEGVFDS